MRYLSIFQAAAQYWILANNPRTPAAVKYLILGGIGLALIPEKWLPSWAPSLDLEDEAALIPSVITLASLLIPDEVEGRGTAEIVKFNSVDSA